LWQDVHVPLPFRLPRRVGPLGVALTAYDIWRRLPPRQRRIILQSARTHGPRIASAAAKQARDRARRKPPRP
jgi:hypothetical protein